MAITLFPRESGISNRETKNENLVFNMEEGTFEVLSSIPDGGKMHPSTKDFIEMMIKLLESKVNKPKVKSNMPDTFRKLKAQIFMEVKAGSPDKLRQSSVMLELLHIGAARLRELVSAKKTDVQCACPECEDPDFVKKAFDYADRLDRLSNNLEKRFKRYYPEIIADYEGFKEFKIVSNQEIGLVEKFEAGAIPADKYADTLIKLRETAKSIAYKTTEKIRMILAGKESGKVNNSLPQEEQEKLTLN